MRDYSQHIIVALDIDEISEAMSLAKKLAQAGVTYVKVNPILLTSYGWKIIGELYALGLQVFADPKFHNTPDVLGKQTLAAMKFGPDMINCAADSGVVAMEKFNHATKAKKKAALSLAVTVLTTKTDAECFETYRRNAEAQVNIFAEQAALAGMDGIVCSGHELKMIRSNSITKHLVTVVPGIRSSWCAKGDQKRGMTPSEAFAAGADYLVMGSQIYKGDPVENWKRTLDEVYADLG